MRRPAGELTAVKAAPIGLAPSSSSGLDPNSAAAKFKNGVLTVTIANTPEGRAVSQVWRGSNGNTEDR
jgi:hypothetical protein